ncbi:MAG TPA: H/ACA RNA-protein complex protein Gar1 [Methanothermococcus okinawensis]|uniref:H/ACA RNA-protein complex protein Gar1 n=1 Tax=Methanothermococcus okinawensis TaxID=155863 RepID=A0A832YU68_9EURY|nr:H/ACA RNA-protein complex protein Gar1 [Methanothermococcus okinawensis]
MKKVKLLHNLPNGRIIGRTNYQPKINTPIFLDSFGKKRLGKIYDIFGPLDRPYLNIIPASSALRDKALEKGEAFILQKGKKTKGKRKGSPRRK